MFIHLHKKQSLNKKDVLYPSKQSILAGVLGFHGIISYFCTEKSER